MENSYKLELGRVDLTDVLVRSEVRQTLNNGHVKRTITAALRKEGLTPDADLRQPLTLSVAASPEAKPFPQFRGLITDAHVDGDNYVLTGCDYSEVLTESPFAGGFGKGMLPAEMFYYLGKSVMPEAVQPENLYVDASRTLADVTGLFSRRKFVFIAPVPAVNLEALTFPIAGGALYIANRTGHADDQYIGTFTDGKMPEEWQDGTTRVRFFVTANDFLGAFERGRRVLSKLLDFLSFSFNYSHAIYEDGANQQCHCYHRSRTLLSVTETPWAYVRDTVGDQRYWMQWFGPHRNGSAAKVDKTDPLVGVYKLFAPLVEEDDRRLSRTQRSLVNATHALRQARQAENPNDALAHIWRCVEYLVSAHQVEPLFTDNEKKAIIKAAIKTIDGSERLKEEQAAQTDRIRNLLNSQLNERPLRAKWRKFCEDYGINLSTVESDALWDLRRSRNDDQHGADTNVRRDSIDSAASTLERAIITMARCLEWNASSES